MTTESTTSTQPAVPAVVPAQQTASRALGLAALRVAVRGRLVTPGDEDWDVVRAPWQRVIDQHPLAVLEVADDRDVVEAVRWAVEHGVPVTAQPVGHGATSSFEGVLVLRTRALREIRVDAPSRTARIGAGVKAGELLAALQGSGLTFLAGSNPDPTVVGLALGGGMSWFGRAWGLTANDVVSVDLVDPSGTLVHVDRATDPDLFWAVRGGGGDFGIVTAMEISLHEAPALYGGRMLWPVERAREVLEAFREVTSRAPRALTLWAHIYHFPPLPEMPEEIRGRSFVAVAVAHLGSAQEAERHLAPLRAVGAPAMDLMGPVAMQDLGTIADEPVEPVATMESSVLLRELSDRAIDAVLAVAGSAPSPLAVVQIRHLGGALAEESPGAGAAGRVEEPYLLFALGVPAAPGLAEAITGSLAALEGLLAEDSSGRTVPNFLGPQGDPARGRAPETTARLAAIKAERDPDGVIRSNRPVR